MERGNDVRTLLVTRLYHFVSNVAQPATFKLFPIGEQLPPHYRLAMMQDVQDHPDALLRAMPLFHIANLEDGSVVHRVGNEIRIEIRDDAREKLAMRLYQMGSDVVGPPVTFKLFCIGVQLPPQYRLATIKEVQDHQEAFLRAMPGCEIANLADGSVDGAALGGGTRMVWNKCVSYQLAMELYPLVRLSLKFQLFHIANQLPPWYRLATVQEVDDHQDALYTAMPYWEIANLADGSVDGALYGSHTRMQTPVDVSHKLATQVEELLVSNITVRPLPPRHRLVTAEEVQDHQEAFLEAMPVNGAFHGGSASMERLQLATKLDQRAGPPMTFKLLRIGDELPAQFRLATGKEISDHREALLTTMPGLEFTNVASYFGKSSCNIGLDWIVIVRSSMATSTSGSDTSSCGGGRYIDVLPDDVVTSRIWPKVISSLLASVRRHQDQYSAVSILWKLRTLNKDWMNLVDSSVEWAAFRLANSFIDAARCSRGVEDTFVKSRDFLCERTKLRKPSRLDLLMAPYPDPPDHHPPSTLHTSHNYLRLLRHANTVGPLE